MQDYAEVAERIELQEEKLSRTDMRLLIIILFALLFAGCADNNLTMKGVQAFDAEEYSLAYKELAPLAARGNPEAQFYIGKMNYFGFGVPKDLDIAFIRYTDSAEQGYMKAQHNLGLMYANGFSVEANPELGYEWISKAAAQGFVLSQFMMGVALTMEGSPLQQDITRGLEYYEAAAQQNHPEAFTQLGEHFAFREGDNLKAGDYFDKAAALGEPQAMNRLAYIYMGGTLRTQDKEKAHNLLKTSAEKKYLPSYYDLAMSYMWGNGVKQNVGAAINWLKKSAVEANDPRAMESLAQTQLENRSGYLTQVSVLDSIESGVELRKKAAELGNAVAQLNLFVQYYNGTHVPNSKSEAIKWLKASSENGNPDAQFELAKQYLNGWDVPKDQKKGISLYESAAKRGHDKALLGLAAAYMAGIGVEKDFSIALEWYNKAPAKDAALMIGLLHMQGGDEVPQNGDLAEEWFKKSDDPEAMMYLAFLYASERYGKWNIEKAISFALKAESDLEGESLNIIQTLLMASYHEENNVEEKIYWLNKLSDADDTQAQAALAIYLMTGDGVEKDDWKGMKLLNKAARNGGVDAQYFLGLLYSIGSEEAGLGRYVEVDEKNAQYWLSMAIAQGDSRADEILLLVNAELKARKEEVARQQEVYRLERIAQFEKSKREKRAAEKQLAEYKRQQEYQARQPKRPSLVESFIGGLFEAVVDGAVMYGQAKINKELGIKSPQERQLDDFRRVADEENERMLRLLKKERRMKKIMKNLQNTPSIGYKN
jgi:TPR repeat protein